MGKSTLPHLVVFGQGYHIGVALKVVLAHILHIHLDTTHAEVVEYDVCHVYLGNSASLGHINLVGGVNLLGQ